MFFAILTTLIVRQRWPKSGPGSWSWVLVLVLGIGWPRNSRPTVINPDYNMTKQRCMKRIYEKIHPKSPPNLATSPTCLHCDVTHLSLTTGVVALHIPSWRIEMREERRRARKIVWPVNAGRVICRYQNNLCGIINHHKHIRYCFFGCLSCGFKHNHNKPYRHWRQDGGWHALPIVTHATAWRRELLFYTSRRQGQPLQFRARNPRSHVIILYHICIQTISFIT